MAGAPTPVGLPISLVWRRSVTPPPPSFFKPGYPALAPVKNSVVTVSLTHSGIGPAAGLLYDGCWISAVNRMAEADSGYLLLLRVPFPRTPGRVDVSDLALFGRGLCDRVCMWKCIVSGNWSYVLDAIGVGAAFLSPGGFWVC